METGTLNERIQIYEPKAERNHVRAVTTRDQMRSGIDVQGGQITVLIRYLSDLSDDCLIRWNDKFYGIDNLSADRHKGEILLGCSYSGLNDNQRIST